MNPIDSLKSSLNPILKLRDDLGAAIAPVSIVTRVWTGLEIGDGTSTETDVPVSPSPKIVSMAHSYRVTQGGQFQEGDLLLKYISKQSFPLKSQIDCDPPDQNIEIFYKIGGFNYRVISVVEELLTWTVQVRRMQS